MPMGFNWTNGLVFGINVEDCAVVLEDEDSEMEDGSVIQVFLGLFMFYVIIRG